MANAEKYDCVIRLNLTNISNNIAKFIKLSQYNI